jgi:tRNA A37 threonylcarbamoyltransferase TsaD
LGKKLVRAALKYNAKTIWLSGWVSANDRLREYITELLENKQRLKNQDISADNFNAELLVPAKKLYCTDNAAMIGVAGLLK